MKSLLGALALCACTGCTMVSLERHTLAQTETVVDMRYREVMDNLAMVAHDPAALPSYSSIYSGSTQITDTEQLGATTFWQHIGVGATAVVGKVTQLVHVQNGFGSETANPQVSRAVLQNWPLDPVVVPEKLEAVRAACRWVLYGPERAVADCPGLLDDPDEVPPGPDRHFNVAKRLAALPPGWIHTGRLCDVPLKACYKAHCGDTWVWVMPDGMAGLADFSLIIQSIVRVQSNSPSLFNLPAYPARLVFNADPQFVYRSRGFQVTAQVALNPWGQLVPEAPYYKPRMDDEQTDANLRSVINASGSQP